MSEERTDLYGVLGLAPSATQDQIRHAYRDLLRRHHPDTRAVQNPMQAASGSEKLLQQVLAAYAVLGDPVRRAQYDQRLRRFEARPPARPPRPDRDGLEGQPPIQAGPVHWHRT
ncbi:MAG: J domain-containing protein [Actinomycetales bacterium]|jgi:curved DNA-binding protein CbpA